MTSSAYLLSPDDVERFNATFEGNPALNEMLEDSAETWREKLRPVHETIEACRWAFLSSMVVRIGAAIPGESRMEDLPTLARYLCMRVEQRVAELDDAPLLPKKCLNKPRSRD